MKDYDARNYDLAVWDPAKCSDMIAHARGLGDPLSCRMNAWDYADVRKFGRDVMDINTDPALLPKGFMGTIYKVAIYQDKSVLRGVISFFGKEDVPISHAVNLRRWARDPRASGNHSVVFHPGPFLGCLDSDVCLALYVMDS